MHLLVETGARKTEEMRATRFRCSAVIIKTSVLRNKKPKVNVI